MSTFNEFSIMVNDYKFDIVAVNETWLRDDTYQQNYVQIPGYNTVFKNRIGKKGGGVGFYLKETLSFKVRNDLNKHHDSLEVLFVEEWGKIRTPLFLSVWPINPARMKRKDWNG